MTGAAVATLEDGPALVADVDSTDRAAIRAQFQLVLQLEETDSFTPVHFEVPDDITFETAEAVANWLGGIKRRTSWYIGDLLIKCESVHGELYAQVAHATGLSEQTLLNLVWVAKAIPPERRKQHVPHSCHAEVAALGAREQTTWLTRCEKHAWSRAQLRDAMKAKRRDDRPTLHDDEDEAGGPVEVLKAILRDARQHEADPAYWLIPGEDLARARAALGMDEEGDTDE